MAAEVVKAGAMVSSKRTIDRVLGRLRMGGWRSGEVVGARLLGVFPGVEPDKAGRAGFGDLVLWIFAWATACAITMLAR